MSNKKDISDLLKDAEEKIKQTEQLQKQLNKELKDVFSFLIDSAFDNIPSLTEIQWDQYAPFELGTEFEVHQVYFSYGDISDKDYKFLKLLEKFLYENKAFLYEKFGDDSRVVITREGISLESVEHG